MADGDTGDQSCPKCDHLFPEIVCIGTMPDTITDITGFVVIVECPRCLFQSTITIHVEEMGVGSELPGGMPPPVKKGESDDKPN